MSDIEEYEFSDEDIIATAVGVDSNILLTVRYGSPWITLEKEDVEAMAKHFGIIE